MASICAAPCHIWSHMSHEVTLVTIDHTCHLWSHLSHVSHVFMSEYPNICIIPYLSLKPGKSLIPVIHFVWGYSYKKILFPEIIFPGSHISQEDSFSRKSHFQRSHISWKIKFLREIIVPREVNFLGSNISREVKITRKSLLPGSH